MWTILIALFFPVQMIKAVREGKGWWGDGRSFFFTQVDVNIVEILTKTPRLISKWITNQGDFGNALVAIKDQVGVIKRGQCLLW